MKIAITGSNGLIGKRVVEILKNEFDITILSSQEMDITDKLTVSKKLQSVDFDILIHLAAYTNVDGAEIEKDKAEKINVLGTKHIFEETQKLGKKMVYFSTDFVFDGKMPPYDELSTPNPLGVYAITKFQGEEIVKDKAMIVRISYPFQELSINQPKPDFIHKIASLLNDGKRLSMIYDGAITPTFIDDIAMGLRHLLKNFKPEIYHLVGSKSYTPYKIGLLIAKKLNIKHDQVDKISYETYSKNKTPRPKYSIILTSKNNFQKMHCLEDFL